MAGDVVVTFAVLCQWSVQVETLGADGADAAEHCEVGVFESAQGLSLLPSLEQIRNKSKTLPTPKEMSSEKSENSQALAFAYLNIQVSGCWHGLCPWWTGIPPITAHNPPHFTPSPTTPSPTPPGPARRGCAVQWQVVQRHHQWDQHGEGQYCFRVRNHGGEW